MALTKAEYEKALGKKLTDEQYAKLTSLSGESVPAQPGVNERDPKAYEGARLMESIGDRTGKMVPVPRDESVAILNKSTGKLETYASLKHAERAMEAFPQAYDPLRAREAGGLGYQPPSDAPKYTANVDTPAGKTPMQLWNAKKGEVEWAVNNGMIGRDTADRIYATARAEEEGEAHRAKPGVMGDTIDTRPKPDDPNKLGTLVAKAKPLDGHDYTPNVMSIHPDAFAEPRPPAPFVGLPNGASPTGGPLSMLDQDLKKKGK